MKRAMQPSILYEDNHILVVEKPVNIPVQADRSGDMDLLTMLKAYIKQAYNKPGAVYLGLIHRLDRPVGGVMVFARTSKAAARLSAQFQTRQVQKRYVAVVQGRPQKEGVLTQYIRAEEGEKRVSVFAQEAPQAKKAVLHYRRLFQNEGAALLDIALHTGRKHQIRAQLAYIGHPIQFDQRYHDNPGKGQIALHAYALSFLHPTKGERLTFTSIPKTPAFALYGLPCTALPAIDAGVPLYMDEALFVCNKAQGVETTKADGGPASLEGRMEACFGPLFPVHRLDVNTGGLVLFARSAVAQKALAHSMREGLLEKYYRCTVVGVPPVKEAVLQAFAKKDSAAGLLHVAGRQRGGMRPIQTGYRVLFVNDGLAELEVRLYTGRTHQIRAHLAYAGFPVLGDDKYGDRAVNKREGKRRQQLFASRLVLHFAPGSPLAAWDERTFALDGE